MNDLKSEFNELNPAQREAAAHLDGPLLVVAGAGTGKTRVIVDRILKLIDSGVSPENILALTFTEKAAAEMLDRVNELRGGFTFDATVMTYNAFGGDLLQRFAADIGLRQNQHILGETGQLVFLRENLDELELDYYAPVSSPDSQLKNISSYISKLKQQLITPDRYQKWAEKLHHGDDQEKLEKQRHQELAQAYAKYIDLCRKRGVIDYDDQIYLIIELLKSRPNIQKMLQEQYQYILVDEFQDTNPMQSKLLDLLTGPKQNLMVVGDDDQSIYGWRGATLANILDFKKRYPTTKEIALIENYRSSQAILDSAYQLIQNNNPNRLEAMHDLDKKLVSKAANGASPKAVHFSSLDAELAWVADNIAKQIKAGVDPGQIAVLARRNYTVQRTHEALEANNIAHVVAGLSTDLYQQPAVTTLIEALKAVNDPYDNVALYHTLGGTLFKLDPHALSEAAATARKEHSPLSELLNQSAITVGREPIQKAMEQIKAWRGKLHELSAGQMAYTVLDESGWKDELYKTAEDDAMVATQVQALGQLFGTLKEFERIAGTPSTLNYLDNLEALRSAGSDLKDDTLQLSEEVVNVLSVHKAKGLEWEVVYIVDCTEGSFPMRNFGSTFNVPEELLVHNEADDHMAEERRLMYVAVTRAKRDLILTHSDTHTGTTKRRPSRFLGEFPKAGLGMLDQTADDNGQTSLELFARVNSLDVAKEVSLPARMISGNSVVLNVSQIGDYLRCPLDFYYRHILNVPQAPNPSAGYGTLIHGVIQQIHEGMERDQVPKLDDLLKQVEKDWPIEGYVSAKQRDRSHAQGRATIKKLYKRLLEEPVPSEIEKSFRVLIPESELTMTGRIDAVFLGETTEVRDYKTGTTVTTPEKAKSRAQKSDQLTLYALAWQILHDEIPGVLSLDFVDTGQRGEVKKQPKTIDNMAAKLADIPNRIKAGKYAPGRDHTFCRHPVKD